MAVAVVIQSPQAPHLEPGLGLALGVELDELDPVTGDVGQEGDEVLLGHGMMDGDELLILHLLDGDGVVVIGLLGLQGRQGHTAAAHHRTAGAVDDVAADGADIELAPAQIAADIAVGDVLAVHQLDDADAQSLGQGLQEGNVRQTLGSLPLGYGLAADTQLFSQLRLGHPAVLPEIADGGSGHIGIHGQHFLSANSIPRRRAACNLRFVDMEA